MRVKRKATWADVKARLEPTDRSVDEQLRFAIGHKRLVEIRYRGYNRVAEPHDYGVHGGTEKVLVYQQRGPARSERRSATGWRLLELSKVENCVALDETFPGSRGQSHQRHLEWDILYARVT